MKSFLKPITLGKLTLPSPVFYAPLAGCSDFPYRKMSAKYKPGLIYCEMVKMDALIRNDPNTYHILDYDRSMHPIGAQLCGSKPQIAAQAAKIIEDLGFDELNLNCGCPVDKVTKDGSGSGLLKNPQLIGEILSKMVAAVNIPVTVKIRAGWDTNQINCVKITQIAEEAGAKAICIHGRTREQGYKGPANWDFIKACKEVARDIKVIGNGDIIDAQSAANIVAYTGCDAILVARGTMGQPWIAQDIYRHFQGEPPLKRTLEDCRQGLLEHFHYTMQYEPERRAIVGMRRLGCWYLKKSSGTREFRERMSRANSLEEIKHLIMDFPLGEGPGEEEVETCNDGC